MAMTDNELIAEFMNPEVIEGFYDSYGKQIAHYYMKLPHGDRTSSYHAADMPMSEFIKRSAYKGSWDWLMPVVEKIEYNTFTTEGFGFHIRIEGGVCNIESSEGVDICYRNDKTKIESVYNAVIDFIKWYNEQKVN